MSAPEKQGLYDPRNEHDACGVGFVANIKGRKSHEVITCGLEILVNLDHRGAVGADPLVGDGAGILIQIPDGLLRDWAKSANVDLPPSGQYAVAMCFLPQDLETRDVAISQFEHFLKVEGQHLIAWRDVPTDTTGLGDAVLAQMPIIDEEHVHEDPQLSSQTCIICMENLDLHASHPHLHHMFGNLMRTAQTKLDHSAVRMSCSS